MKTLILITSLLLSQITWAAGGTYCNLKTIDASIDLSMVNARLTGAPVISGGAIVKIKNSPDMILEKKDLIGWWSMNEELKINFAKYATGNDLSDTQLIIVANYSDVHEVYVGMANYTGPQGEVINEIIHCELE